MAILRITPDKKFFTVQCSFEQRNIPKKIGCRWNPSMKSWNFAIDLTLYSDIQKAFGNSLEITDQARQVIQNKIIQDNTIKKFKEQAQKNQDINYSVPGLSYNGKNPLYIYQKHGVRCGTVAQGGFLIGDEPGVGKTIQGIGIALNKKILNHARQCLVVCPACVKYNWLNEIQKFTKEKALVIDGKVQQRYQKWFATGYFFKIVNYEILVRDLFYVQKTDKLGNITSKDNRIPDCQQLIDNYFQIMIIDQAHYLSSTNALRTLACKGMKVKTKIALTGTPVNGRLSQMYSIMEVIKPGLFPSRSKFLQRYAIFDHFGGVKQWIRIDQFKNKIQPYYIRRLKKDVLQQLPPMIIQTMYAQFSDKARKQYNKLVKGQCDLTVNDQMLVRVIRARQFCNCPSILGKQYDKVSKDKLIVFKDLCNQIIKQNGHKVVVFSQYRQTVNILFQELKKQKYQVVLLKSFKNKFQGSEYFNNSKTANIFLCTDQGMTGLNLGSASYLINYDVSWSPAVNLQRYARIHRANSKHAANIINLVVKDTIQQRILQAIQDKLTLNDNVLDQNFTDDVVTQPISTRDLYNML